MSFDMAQFRQVFFEESIEGLDTMESGLLNLSNGDDDPEEINAIFRAAHSIKGGSGTFGFVEVSGFTHVMETLLDEMRDGRREVTRESVDVLLSAVDCLREMLTAIQSGSPIDTAKVIEHQNALENELGASNTRSNTEQASVPQQSGGIEDSTPANETSGWTVHFKPHPHMLRTGNDPVRMFRELESLGQVKVHAAHDQVPAFDELDPENCYLTWEVTVFGHIARAQIDEIFDWVEGDCDLYIVPLGAIEATGAPDLSEGAKPELNAVEQSAEQQQIEPREGNKPVESGSNKTSAAKSGSSTIRVETGKIDSMINMVGELVITQSMLSMLGEDFDMSKLDDLKNRLAHLERYTRELQESVMNIRMLPISFVFSRFPRLVHDISKKLGKKIDLKLSGETTEVDKTVIEMLSDPLVHLIRNSLDHGIEMPKERVRAGKSEVGLVHLNAFHQGGNIVIQISDDGKGLDSDRILNRAIERGLVDPNANLSARQIYDLIFTPGFSTADTISDVSGRGVGMDVVRRNVEELGGRIDITSEIGKGSTFSICLPLTLAILDGQLVRVGDETYIIPLVSIIESICVRAEMLHKLASKGEIFKLRDEYLPIMRIHELFGIETATTKSLTDGLLVVVEGQGKRCGLLVDELLGQQQIVIKSLEANYRRVPGISGATILGDGSVGLILDVTSFIRLASQHLMNHGSLH